MQLLPVPDDPEHTTRDALQILTKEQLIDALRAIRNRGWIQNARPGNQGGIGNTLEDVLGVQENNLPLPNAAEWELKCHRAGSSALITLFHMEPSPRACRLVPNLLLPQYGWPHQSAGLDFRADEMSFRQTIQALSRSDRGFKVILDRSDRKVLVSFDSNAVASRHAEWLASIEARVGLGELAPQPYWGFDDLFHKAGTKLLNTFYIEADVRRVRRVEYYHYSRILVLEQLNLDRLLSAFEGGDLLVDVDARTGHNHGTKFRLRRNKLPDLYANAQELA